MSVLKLKNLSKNYGSSRGINDINFEINEQEIFGFIGPNGAGKSTTIRTILGLLKKDEGDVFIFGKKIENNVHTLLHKIGYLPSEISYYDKLTAHQLLDYSASFYHNVDPNRIIYLANYLELDLNKKIDDMSLGNKKKVGIIQGLLHSPEFIILDEPTSGLDPLIQKKFFELLKEENKKGATILFSSHILSEVQKICDRVAIIKEGQIIKIEDIKEMKHKNYRKVLIDLEEESNIDLSKIEGLSNLKHSNKQISFLYQGTSKDLLNILNQLNITSFEVNEPDLEEVFMHYYE